MFRAAIALFALAVPAFAQHGGGHAGSFAGSGSAGHSSFSGNSGFSRPSNPGFSHPGNPGFARPGNFVRPAAPAPYGGQGFRTPNYAIRPSPTYGNRFTAPRSEYHSTDAGPSRTGNQNSNRDRNWDRAHRDRFDARRRDFRNWYLSDYPAFLGYENPYLLDPGFYDWSDSDDSMYDEDNGPAPDAAPYQGYGAPDESPQQDAQDQMPPPNYPPWPGPGSSALDRTAPPQQPATLLASSAPAPEEPLTVIFKSGRAPVKMQNYMMTPKVLTDLDSQHFEQIPLDQIDVAATQQANRAAGVQFQVPAASRD